MDIGLKIRKLRLEKEIFQQELEGLCNLPKSTIAKIESGRREVSALELFRIASALGVSVSCFFKLDSIAVSGDELLIVEALRLIKFDKYKKMIKALEADLYYGAKVEKLEKKTKLKELVVKLSQLTVQDIRPRVK